MKSSKRAERRHHNARLLKNRYKREVSNLYRGGAGASDDDLDWAMRRAKRRVDTNVDCSCAGCGNPRRSGWLTWDGGLTFQERRAEDAQRDGIQDFVENA